MLRRFPIASGRDPPHGRSAAAGPAPVLFVQG
jgi:hypothetical protein